MKFVSFTHAGNSSWGVSDNGAVYDLGPSGAGLAPSLREAIAAGLLAGVSIDGLPSVPEAEVQFDPVIRDSAKIICIGANYRAHQKEAGRSDVTAPTVFFRYADSQMGHGQPAVFPASSTQFDYEGEMALVIGSPAWRVPAAEAYDHVAGYACYNDFSVRDWQLAAGQWGPGKNFPATGGFGPYFVPASEVGDVAALTLETRVNGEVRQHTSVGDLTFDIPAIIEHVTAFTPLSPGDVIVTGTPGGVGLFMEPSGLLSPGDVVEVEITGLGVLRNEVVAE
ncbi:MAG: fumarylacetoacetate hydrolase family protein [Dermatophilus congolensis]|nr:fumarylacetoacetate hydrolase family protein [Dermatophilus congolensis]